MRQRFYFGLAFSVVIIMLLFASGCMQNSEAQIIKQVQGYLPETVQLKSAEYESEKLENSNEVMEHSWRLYGDAKQEPDVLVCVSADASGKIIAYENIIEDHYITEVAEKALDEAAAKQLATSCVADWSKEEALELQPWGSNTAAFETMELSENELGWTAASAEDNYYNNIIINTRYGYVKRFEKYYANPQLRQQVLDWLETEETKLYEPYYHILGFYAVNVHEYQDGDNYTLILSHVIQYKSESDPEDTASMQWAKENLPETYPILYDEYNQNQESILNLKIISLLQEEGILDMDMCLLYAADINTEGKEVWTQIPDLSVLIHNERADLPGGWTEQ